MPVHQEDQDESVMNKEEEDLHWELESHYHNETLLCKYSHCVNTNTDHYIIVTAQFKFLNFYFCKFKEQ